MAKNKKRHSGATRTYQDLKRQEAQQAKALTDEALLPGKSGSRNISLLGAAVMLAVFLITYLALCLQLWLAVVISLVCGMGSILLSTFFAIRKNRSAALRKRKN